MKLALPNFPLMLDSRGLNLVYKLLFVVKETLISRLAKKVLALDESFLLINGNNTNFGSGLESLSEIICIASETKINVRYEKLKGNPDTINF